MTSPHADRISGVNLKFQSKNIRFEFLHPVPIAHPPFPWPSLWS